MKVDYNVSLRRFNSFKFESTADEFVEASSVEELRSALDTDRFITILGEGSNVVLHPHLSGRTIKLNLIDVAVTKLGNSGFRVFAGAGVNWHELVRRTLGMGITGLENLALIPGSVGAAPFQNIGAYGVELKDVLECVVVLDRQDLEVKHLPSESCGFGYRTSVFKESTLKRYVITGIQLRLGTSNLVTHYPDVQRFLSTRGLSQIDATKLAETVIATRRRKLPDPRVIGNAGSFFKNPHVSVKHYDHLRETWKLSGYEQDGQVKLSAAQLIDLAGWKGRVLGSAQVWPKQPLVLVNRGDSTAAEVLTLSACIADDVRQRYGISLVLEPVVMGEA